MVTITTLYPWGNPEDIDTLITKKIENQISSIEGINHIDSTSTNNFFTIVVTLENRVDANTISTYRFGWSWGLFHQLEGMSSEECFEFY